MCTTDDPVDELRYHEQMAAEKNPLTRVYPGVASGQGVRRGGRRRPGTTGWGGWRPHRAWPSPASRPSSRPSNGGMRPSTLWAAASPITDSKRCGPSLGPTSRSRRPSHGCGWGRLLETSQALALKSAMLHRLAVMDHSRGWVQQYHLGALRNNNTRMRRRLGPDTGFDSIGDFEQGRPLAQVPGSTRHGDRLAKTILYNLNPRDNELFATIMGCFQDGSVAGKIQLGSAWWFLDQKDGMEAQIKALSNLGLLARFVGMLTDSRSFLSYLATRVLPSHSVQPPGRRRQAWTATRRPRSARSNGGRHQLLQRARLLRFRARWRRRRSRNARLEAIPEKGFENEHETSLSSRRRRARPDWPSHRRPEAMGASLAPTTRCASGSWAGRTGLADRCCLPSCSTPRS